MKVVLAFKNPSRPLNDTFEIESLLEASIGELKQTLHGVYPGNPLPEAITLIYAGKVLKDNAMPLSSFISTDTSSPVAIHIVVKGASTSSSSAAIEARERPSSAASVSSSQSIEAPVRDPPAVASAPVAPAAVAATEAVLASEPVNIAPAAPPAAPAAVPAPAPQVHVQPPQPPAQPEQPSVASTSQQQPQAPQPATAPAPTQAPAASPFPPGMDAYYSNQMAYSVAYQSAYQAALQSIFAAQQQQQQQQQHQQQSSDASGSQPPPQPQQMFYPMPMPFAPPPMPYYNPYQYQYNHPMMMHPPQYQFPGGAMDVRQRRRAAAVVAAVAGGPDGRVPEDLLRRLRELRNRGFQLPPELVLALDREEARAAGGVAGGARAPRVHRFQFRIQINIRALLQLAVLLVVVYQHCPPKRFAALCILGFALWLSTTPRVRAFLQQIAGLGPNNRRRGGVPVPVPVPAPHAVAADGQPAAVEAAGDAPAPAPVQPNVDGAAPAAALNNNNPLDAAQFPADQLNEPRAGILQEIHAFVVGFITSLLPAMEHNNNDDAAAGGAMRDVFGGEQ